MKTKKYSIKEIEKAMVEVLPAFPHRCLKEKLSFLDFVWKQTKKMLEGR